MQCAHDTIHKAVLVYYTIVIITYLTEAFIHSEVYIFFRSPQPESC